MDLESNLNQPRLEFYKNAADHNSFELVEEIRTTEYSTESVANKIAMGTFYPQHQNSKEI